MICSRSLETRLLLVCVRTTTAPQLIQRLVRRNLDWHDVIIRAEHYGITPLLHFYLSKLADKTSIPLYVMEQVQSLTRWHLFRNMNFYRELREILSVFAEREIPVIVLKGAALASLVYGDITLRPMADIDLLVRRQDLDVVERLLHILNYVPNEACFSQAWYRDHHHHLVPYVKHDRGFVLEIHHHISPPLLSEYLPVYDLWQRARPVQIATLPTFMLAPEDLLLHLSLHLIDDILGRGMAKPRILGDIAETIRQYQRELDWELLLRNAEIYAVEKYLYYALWLSREMVAAEVKTQILCNLRSSIRGGLLEDIALKFIMQRAILRLHVETSPIPSWVIYDVCGILLSSGGKRNKIRAMLTMIQQRYSHSALQVDVPVGISRSLYMRFIHPVYLLLRAVGRVFW